MLCSHRWEIGPSAPPWPLGSLACKKMAPAIASLLLPLGVSDANTPKQKGRHARHDFVVDDSIFISSDEINKIDSDHTVDGRNPAPVEVGSLSDYFQSFIHPSVVSQISSINSMESRKLPNFNQNHSGGFYWTQDPKVRLLWIQKASLVFVAF